MTAGALGRNLAGKEMKIKGEKQGEQQKRKKLMQSKPLLEQQRGRNVTEKFSDGLVLIFALTEMEVFRTGLCADGKESRH